MSKYKITTQVTEFITAKFSELVTVVDVVNLSESLLDEENSEFSSKVVANMFKDAMKVVNKRLGIKSTEELEEAFQQVKQQVTLTMQLDRISKELEMIGASQTLVKELDKLKEKNLKDLSKKLSFDLSMLETKEEENE